MWVLNTRTAELHSFPNSAAVHGGYAILSHTWGPQSEQTYQEVQKIAEECKNKGGVPRDHFGLQDKIRRCCEIAESDGYEWIWIDSCCIDKESSAELSEAINSMFNWYALAEVCYVYLQDVPYADAPEAKESTFRKARWHLRGWTLQELLAPAFVIFFSKDWDRIGTKYDLRGPLSECTGIDEVYLTHKKDFRVDASIAMRMSWAAKRKTTRVEDEAYCLMGLFDINMPTLYGEGRHAFQRLQAELVRQSTDATLFAWGNCHRSSDNKQKQGTLSESQRHDRNKPYIFLFASSPSRFSTSPDICYPPRTPSPASLQSPPNSQRGEKDNRLDQARDKVPSFELTAYGMKCWLPVAQVDGVTIAVLPCKRNGEYLGLLLHPASKDQKRDSSRRLYYVSWTFRQTAESKYEALRLACLGGDPNNLRFRGKTVSPTWRDIYVYAHPSATGRRDVAGLLQGFVPDVAPTSFRIPRTLMQTLSALEFFPATKIVTWDETSKNTTQFKCESATSAESIRILFGSCKKASTEEYPCHWAWADQHHHTTWNQSWLKYKHDCATDHIKDWPDYTREFGDTERTIRLAFAPCTHAPKQTLVLNLELVGSVYKEIQSTMLASISSSSSQPTLVPDPAIVPPLPVSHRQSNMSYAEATRGRRGMSTGSINPAGPKETRRSATHMVNGTNCLTDIPSNPRDAARKVVRENNATRDPEIQALKEAHHAQTRKLNEALAELAQLKAQFAQFNHSNGTAPPPTALERRPWPLKLP